MPIMPSGNVAISTQLPFAKLAVALTQVICCMVLSFPGVSVGVAAGPAHC